MERYLLLQLRDYLFPFPSGSSPRSFNIGPTSASRPRNLRYVSAESCAPACARTWSWRAAKVPVFAARPGSRKRYEGLGREGGSWPHFLAESSCFISSPLCCFDPFLFLCFLCFLPSSLAM